MKCAVCKEDKLLKWFDTPHPQSKGLWLCESCEHKDWIITDDWILIEEKEIR